MSASAQSIVLKDGRRLGFSEYGDPDGRPLFYFHGFPGSRLEAELTSAGALRQGVRVLAVDRPGFGASDFAAQRTLLDWPGDVEQLAAALGYARFAVLGLSGGGPYALACAWKIPARLTAAGVVCGLGPLADKEASRALKWPAHLSFILIRHRPRLFACCYELLARWFMRRHPRWVLHLMHVSAPWPDREVLRREPIRLALIDSVHEAVRQGGQGPVRDLVIYSRPWGFPLQEIAMPVHLWHGEADVTVPASMGHTMAAQLPDCCARFLPGEGHFSLLINHLDEILTTVASEVSSGTDSAAGGTRAPAEEAG